MCVTPIQVNLLTYRTKDEVKHLIRSWKEEHAPIYTFTAEDGVKHVAWKITDEDVITTLVNAFEDIPNLYIADGHHRSASAAKVGLMRREQYPNYTGERNLISSYRFYSLMMNYRFGTITEL